jgi:hypothetical protein
MAAEKKRRAIPNSSSDVVSGILASLEPLERPELLRIQSRVTHLLGKSPVTTLLEAHHRGGPDPAEYLTMQESEIAGKSSRAQRAGHLHRVSTCCAQTERGAQCLNPSKRLSPLCRDLCAHHLKKLVREWFMSRQETDVEGAALRIQLQADPLITLAVSVFPSSFTVVPRRARRICKGPDSRRIRIAQSARRRSAIGYNFRRNPQARAQFSAGSTPAIMASFQFE